jgi:hypothetical protein
MGAHIDVAMKGKFLGQQPCNTVTEASGWDKHQQLTATVLSPAFDASPDVAGDTGKVLGIGHAGHQSIHISDPVNTRQV